MITSAASDPTSWPDAAIVITLLLCGTYLVRKWWS